MQKVIPALWILFTFSGYAADRPNVVMIVVDTLRADRLGIYGYSKNTSPVIDKLLSRGVVFNNARTVEPLTAPAMISVITSRYPHDHGASRNGLSMYPGLPSLGKVLRDEGYRTGAVVGNWTLRTGLTGLAEHFQHFEEVLLRKRWFGMIASESDAEDITSVSTDFLARQNKDRPFFLWVHYTDPHAPYKLHKDVAGQLGLPWKNRAKFTRSDRYDMEVAYTDAHIGRLLKALEKKKHRETLIVFISDHGESLGEHGYWGHGRNLYEPTLHVPMAFVRPGGIRPAVVDAPATLLDIAPTVLGLLEIASPREFDGYDWSDVLVGGGRPDPRRMTFHQAHRGVVLSVADQQRGRERGLLELAVVADHVKETFRVNSRTRRVFDLTADPAEHHSKAAKKSKVSEALRAWALDVEQGLYKIDNRQEALSNRDLEMLRSLGYIDD
ncbi:MAG: sulfatase [Acidobacteriota bacterium]|nr:sulfatase [Acidobacteriota bacterium]